MQTKFKQSAQGHDRRDDGDCVNQGRTAKLVTHRSHQRQRCHIHAIEESTRRFGFSNARQQWTAGGNQQKRREKDADCGNHRAVNASEEIANECGRRKYWSWRHLPHGYGVNELRIGEPSVMHNEIRTKECRQNVTTFEHDRPHL
jgi:hypothetical protein